MAVDPIRITGLVELQRALKAADGESQKQLRVVLNEAAEVVAAEARKHVPVRTGAARKSYRAQSGQRDAKVIAGTTKVNYVRVLEFGGRAPREGRYLLPAWNKKRAAVTTMLEESLVALARNAGFDVKAGG